MILAKTSLDAVNLAKSGATVREVTSGCICCSLQGNFQQALLDILQNYEIDVIYIEPSGVSKLSEIIHTCRMKKLQNPPMCTLQLRPLMQCRHLCLSKTLVSSLKDQITHSDAIFLSHTEDIQQTSITNV